MEVERLRSFLQFPDSDNAVLDNKASPRYGNNPALTDASSPLLTIVHLIILTEQPVNYFRQCLRQGCHVSSS